MKSKTIKRTIAVITLGIVLQFTCGMALADSTIIFEDQAQRADSSSPGPAWQEFFMRETEGRISRAGDTPWSIQGNSLYYSTTGQNSYIEDFIQTADTFPVDNTVIEFDFRGSARTSAGYVGPVVLWATDAEQRTGFAGAHDGRAAIGAGAWYRWENAGTKGLVLYRNGSSSDYPNATFAGLNQASFNHHVITIKNNTLTYQSDSFAPVTVPLSSALASGERRHLSLGVRLYDQGVPQVLEFRNLKISTESYSYPPDYNHPDQITGPMNYSRNTLEFLQQVLDQNYPAALQKTSPAFQQENQAERLQYLRSFIMENAAHGSVAGKTIMRRANSAYLIVYIKNPDGSMISLHFNYAGEKIDQIMGRWGR